ncbi:winged helix-turn-helix transcriptional regulator [Longitalea luteola]|uniref:winged helix-turn-helix transcriptional regulator n=1 Tax=Longitalea luteola TaxID=2812563 RepID=UPI002106CCD2|nr:helix-turn-helix domain-containing protein [Longitalea luteola]
MEKNTIAEHQHVNDQNNLEENEKNPMTAALQAIGGKWKLLLLDSIRRECPKRFGELRKEMKYITQTTLTAQLRELERDGILTRAVFPEVPPRVEYKLTALGKQLIPIMDALCEWGKLYDENKSKS